MDKKHYYGKKAEKKSATFLADQGLNIIETNFNCKFGEIDIIATDSTTLVFIEVRYRTHGEYGTGVESVNPIKQQRLIKTARFYLWQNKLQNLSCRFDIISIDKYNTVTWIKDAFHINYDIIF